MIFWGFAAAGALNAVLAGQMLMYWKNDGPPSGTANFKRRSTEDGLYSSVKTESEIASKRWSGRKLD